MPRLQGVIFDLDGTLMDSVADLRQALNVTLAGQDRRELTLNEVKSLVGDGLGPLLQRAFALTGNAASKDDISALFPVFIRNYHNVKPDPSQLYPHVVETLQMLRELDIKIGLCTNKLETATLRLMQELDLTQYFGFIAGGDTFPEHKPHPNHVRGVMTQLKVPAAGCVMIGDSPNDVLAAHGAGIPCLVMTHGYYMEDHEQLGADGLISDFKQLPEGLEKLGFYFKSSGPA